MWIQQCAVYRSQKTFAGHFETAFGLTPSKDKEAGNRRQARPLHARSDRRLS